MALPDWFIRNLAIGENMISPYSTDQITKSGAISSGQSSYGYDVTAADEFQIFTNANGGVVSPKNFNPDLLTEGRLMSSERGIYILAPPNSFVLASSVEYIRMPRNVVGLMTVKSTYARCGIVSPPTVLEPEWEGHITIEISNTTPLPAEIYANEGIAQILFFQSDYDCEISYKDRKGKYQGQEGITLPKVKTG